MQAYNEFSLRKEARVLGKVKFYGCISILTQINMNDVVGKFSSALWGLGAMRDKMLVKLQKKVVILGII